MTDLERVLFERYEQVKANIENDQRLADEFAQKTQLRTGDMKRHHVRMNERIQIEWYKFDELMILAHRAGIDLKGGGNRKEPAA